MKKINHNKINLYNKNLIDVLKILEKKNIKIDIFYADYYATFEGNKLKQVELKDIVSLSEKLYKLSFTAIDIEEYIYYLKIPKVENLLMQFNLLKKEIRNEEYLIMYLLNNILLRSNYDLENMLIM